MKKTVILFLVLMLWAGTCSAVVKTGTEKGAFASTTRGDFPIEYVTFFNYGERMKPDSFHIALFIVDYKAIYGWKTKENNRLALKTSEALHVAEYTGNWEDYSTWGAFQHTSLIFKLPAEAITAIINTDDITLVGYYPVGYFEYRIPTETLKEWRTVINKGPVTYPNPIKF